MSRLFQTVVGVGISFGAQSACSTATSPADTGALPCTTYVDALVEAAPPLDATLPFDGNATHDGGALDATTPDAASSTDAAVDANITDASTLTDAAKDAIVAEVAPSLDAPLDVALEASTSPDAALDATPDAFCDNTWPTTKGGSYGPLPCVDINNECAKLPYGPSACAVPLDEYACDARKGIISTACVSGQWSCGSGRRPAFYCRCWIDPDYPPQGFQCTKDGLVAVDAGVADAPSD